MPLCVWNVRGINDPLKAREVNKRRAELKVSVFGLVETKVKKDSFDKIREICCPRWRSIDNYDKHPSGRIWVCWNENEERIGRSLVHPSESSPLTECLLEAGLQDLSFSGFFFTWSNHSEGQARIMSKIDRCLVNSSWSSLFSSQAEFLPHGVSDHSPILLSWFNVERKAFPFRFNNAWLNISGMMEVVLEAWSVPVYANPMQVLLLKQKNLKNKLKEWAKIHCSLLHEKVQQAYEQLENVQRQLQSNPTDVSLGRLEKSLLRKYCNLAEAEHNQIRQQASCDWLTMGDRSTAYFHFAVKERKNRKTIRALDDRLGNKLNTEASIVAEITSYYKELLGTDDLEVDADSIREVFLNCTAARNEWTHKFPLDTKVATIISVGSWNQDVLQLQDHDLKVSILNTKINSRLEMDKIIWLPSKSGRFSVSSAYRITELYPQKFQISDGIALYGIEW
ncbi:Dnase i-like superfamily protein [Thalictrum thalictroides]|uniref:Dnase i-like superfamily protein n=1 Tax=Thalictrum thalictroides TaxID=46969 RepID=A0A7J6VKE4_THATH|nr:Dnase i-like superfamily protein [Thalictrum thalictroides]